ncbi:hypothetical protein PL373_06075 [Tenacibaculum maritimum]|nr:hypothetical protein [Tenacibaculum maritimum]MDB0600718.1 hypothetical protein [Tenacibaculum maritimum]MDB0612701.1 hypothetical protein [Tenacibaculum maritimum]
MTLKFKFTNDMLMATHQILKNVYNPTSSLLKEQKIIRSIGFELADLFEKKCKKQIEKVSLFDQTKKTTLSLKYHQAWALQSLIIDLIYLHDSPFQKVQLQKIINLIDKEL